MKTNINYVNLILAKPLNVTNAKFNSLNKNSSLFKTIENSEYNLIDHYSCVCHFYHLNIERLNHLLFNLRDVIKNDTIEVFYQLIENSNVCFYITSQESEGTDEILIYDHKLIKDIEDILEIKFCTTKQQLQKSRFNENFEEQILNRVLLDDTPLNNELSICQEENSIILSTMQSDTFMAGIEHINYLVNAQPKHAWLPSHHTPPAAGYYKHLRLIWENTVEIVFYYFNGETFNTQYSFQLEISLSATEDINRVINQNSGAENSMLFTLLKRIIRVIRVSRLLEEM
jgi:hypothetical protein